MAVLLQLQGRMDVKFVTVLVVLAVMVSQTSETLFPGTFNCCMKISDEIPKVILRRVEKFETQKADGPCRLEAIILHMKDRKLCVNPCNRKVQKMMKKMKHKIHRSKCHVRNQRRTRNTKQIDQKQLQN